MAQTLYYNKTTKQLLVGNKSNHDLTQLDIAQQISPDTFQIQDQSYIGVWDVNKKQYVPLSDADGNPISFKGEPGQDGAPGRDGQDAVQYPIYHLELSNDMDQIYVDEDGNVEQFQGGYCLQMSVYKDGFLSSLKDWDIHVSGDYISSVTPDGGITIFIQENTNLQGIEQLVYGITCINKYDPNLVLSKEFKIKVLMGTTDYDLVVPRGFIKLNSDGSIADNSLNIEVHVKERTFGRGSRITYYSPSQLYDAVKCKVFYSFSDDHLIELTSDSISLEGMVLNKESRLTIQLYKNQELIDKAVLECVQDGAEGGSYTHIELSNEVDQFYVKEDKITTQSSSYVRTIVSCVVNDTPIDIFPEDVIFPDADTNGETEYYKLYKDYAQVVSPSGDKVQSVLVNCQLKQNAEVPQNVTSFKIPIEVGGHLAYFTLIKLSGSVDYDLVVSPDYMQCVYDDTDAIQTILPNDQILVQLKATSNEVTHISVNYLDHLPLGFKLTRSVDGGEEVDVTMFFNGDYTFAVSDLTGGDLQKTPRKIVINLYNNNNILLDSAEVAILRDGKKGDKGESGSSPISLICNTGNLYKFYINENGKALEKDQSYDLDFSIIHGQDLVPITDAVIVCPENAPKLSASYFGILHDTEDVYIPGNYTYTVNVTYNGRSYSTFLQVEIIKGVYSYDLTASPSYIHYNPNTSSYNDVFFIVYKQCNGGGYTEQYECDANDTNYVLQFETASSSDDQFIEDSAINDGILRYKLSAASPEQHIVKCYEKYANGNLELEDFVILTLVKDGKDTTITSFPSDAPIGTSILWGGESGVNSNVISGYAVNGITYTKQLIPPLRFLQGSLLSTEKLVYFPLHLIVEVPGFEVESSGNAAAISFNASPADPIVCDPDSNILLDYTYINDGTALSQSRRAISHDAFLYGGGIIDTDKILQYQPNLLEILRYLYGSCGTASTANGAQDFASPGLVYSPCGEITLGELFGDTQTIQVGLKNLISKLWDDGFPIITAIKNKYTSDPERYKSLSMKYWVVQTAYSNEQGAIGKFWTSECPAKANHTALWVPVDYSIKHSLFSLDTLQFINVLPTFPGEMDKEEL